MGDTVRFDKLEQIGKVKRVTTVFIPGKINGQVWYATFKAKADAGNLNMNEKKLLLVGHFEDPDLILWWNENSASTTTLDEVDTLFLEAHGSTGVTQAHAVYGMACVRLNLGDNYDKFVERFVDVYIQANPNRRKNDRISSFINALYPELREELEIEQIYTDWDQLKRRVGYLHAKQQKKARARIAGVQQRDERDKVAELRKPLDQQAAQIAALRGRGRGRGGFTDRGRGHGRGGFGYYHVYPSPMHGGHTFGAYGRGGFNSHFRRGYGGMRGRGGHYQQYGGNNGFNNGPPRCYTCNQPGHKASNCPMQGNDPDVDRPTVGLSAVGQTGVSVVGEITAKFSYPSLPKKVFPHRLTVTEDSGYEAVLEQDVLKLLDPVVEGTEGEKTVILRKNLIYSRGFPGLAIPDQVVDVKAGVATVEVMNIATNLIRLGPNSLLTFAEPFSRVSSVTTVTTNASASAYIQQPPIPKKEDSPVPAPPSQKLPPVDVSHLLCKLRERYEGVLQEYSDLWSRSRFDIGELRVDGKPFEVTIPTGDSPPIRWNQDRIPYH
uniref:CCHC-type domain-containing protein n=1 Tax=Chromera velia CCMP2878 TaxID=1169474 RepID=A0A0G4I506_9ALVE|eukprot:Cvel_11058.t1-p1 / transcript=Cvel_11058.t1 / gene=Cvel_11058 / organism=Chromera_velia_CCMP2878 / gene_product=hypothetical protein / transcript_product=hypothetical protein / location=Cvel_scaffold682:39117-41293(+) / protein_length=548 / sequence_SO=supercontig / SO=protein_coding / is_pseudo=false